MCAYPCGCEPSLGWFIMPLPMVAVAEHKLYRTGLELTGREQTRLFSFLANFEHSLLALSGIEC